MPRWLPLLIAGLLGIALGLFYGWILSPVQYTDITPAALRIDYRSDYVLMVAEAYNTEQAPERAARRLAVLGSQAPALIVEEIYQYARTAGYHSEDLVLLQELMVAMQSWQPVAGTAQP